MISSRLVRKISVAGRVAANSFKSSSLLARSYSVEAHQSNNNIAEEAQIIASQQDKAKSLLFEDDSHAPWNEQKIPVVPCSVQKFTDNSAFSKEFPFMKN
ncbi:hypothetical protein AYI69_g3419 [Smittium culicis]|uniref:Uncharacterized protein n=1 Tax=Smittium culicis TaxID=133412 RepID=A0A1R1X3J5_9FUNG|nr:hypothetical protein AYI69_g10784 [Smittium culicis]OMJ27154.1 hypothetical protein AYI69_g3419 [Smittium culicis]